MSKHTAGPWRYDNDAMLPEEWFLDCPITWNGMFIAAAITSPDGVSLKDAKANARLIAAAPDLLAALQELVGWMAEVRPRTAQLESAEDKARAAITKATGE